MLKPPSKYLADLLRTAGVINNDWPAYIGVFDNKPNTTPQQRSVVVLYDFGGDNPHPNFKIDYPAVVIDVKVHRSVLTANRSAYELGWERSRLIKDALLGYGDYNASQPDELAIFSITMLGDITFDGIDQQEFFTFSTNWELIVEERDSEISNTHSSLRGPVL